MGAPLPQASRGQDVQRRGHSPREAGAEGSRQRASKGKGPGSGSVLVCLRAKGPEDSARGREGASWGAGDGARGHRKDLDFQAFIL